MNEKEYRLKAQEIDVKIEERKAVNLKQKHLLIKAEHEAVSGQKIMQSQCDIDCQTMLIEKEKALAEWKRAEKEAGYEV